MREVKLSKEKVALVDDEDFWAVSQYKWSASLESRGKKWYAIRFEGPRHRQRKIRLHHFVLGIKSSDLEPGEVVVHLNHQSLDCQKKNLERVTQRVNMLRSPNWKRSGVSVEPFL